MVKRGQQMRPQASEGEAQHYFAGLDVSVKETSVCIVDDASKIVREVRVASEPEALLQVLTNTIYLFQASWAALTYRVTVDVPARFRNSKAVGAVFGLTGDVPRGTM